MLRIFRLTITAALSIIPTTLAKTVVDKAKLIAASIKRQASYVRRVLTGTNANLCAVVGKLSSKNTHLHTYLWRS